MSLLESRIKFDRIKLQLMEKEDLKLVLGFIPDFLGDSKNNTLFRVFGTGKDRRDQIFVINFGFEGSKGKCMF